MITPYSWKSFETDPEAFAPNVDLTVFDGLKAVWSGKAIGTIETERGSLSVRRMVMIDGHQITTEVTLIAAGRWSHVETSGFSIDLEQVAEQERLMNEAKRANEEMIAEQRRQTAEARLGLVPGAPVGMGPNRAMRRHNGG